MCSLQKPPDLGPRGLSISGPNPRPPPADQTGKPDSSPWLNLDEAPTPCRGPRRVPDSQRPKNSALVRVEDANVRAGSAPERTLEPRWRRARKQSLCIPSFSNIWPRSASKNASRQQAESRVASTRGTFRPNSIVAAAFCARMLGGNEVNRQLLSAAPRAILEH